ncbi:lysozyme inhibitor LprI family protein [Neobacillus sp. 19]|uniref:lysozyme inhibitor LprI family protein n=1 Tax=Neobacillus sp. 19 TaxID=3394458 RepID=UPI003BF76E82
MKNNRKILTGMISVVFVILLAACGKSSEESSAKLEKQSQNNHLSQKTKDDSSNDDSIESSANTDANNNDTNEKVDPSNNVPAKDEDSSTHNAAVSLKDEYLKKLNDTKKEMDEMKPTDSSTFAAKKVEGDRFDVWDGLLNEVYGVLKEQLSTEEMDQLKIEQRNWINYRDNTALEASQKYKGGTQEHLEYVAVLANLTEERCYKLVEDYME